MNTFATQSSRAARSYSVVNIESGVPSASPHQLVLMLFDGAIQSVSAAQSYCAAGKLEAKNSSTSKALRVIEEGLRASLDRPAGGELAARLDRLYEYMSRRLLSASLHSAPDEYAEVGRLLAELRSGWAEIGINSQSLANAA